MNTNDVLMVIVLGFFVFVLGVLLGVTLGKTSGVDTMERKAISAGVGEYNPTNGVFYFKKPN